MSGFSASLFCSQPLVAILPSRKSRAMAILLRHFLHMDRASSGCSTAIVAITTLSTPRSSQCSTALSDRKPPPSCIGALLRAAIFSIISPLVDFPSRAPSRSTTCNARAPCSRKSFACCKGSLWYEVARFFSPWYRRTHSPPFKSRAGYIIIFYALIRVYGRQARKLASIFCPVC